MRLNISNYTQFLAAVNSLGQNGPTFHYSESGALNICSFVHRGVVTWAGVAPETFSTDFPCAVNVKFDQISSFS